MDKPLRKSESALLIKAEMGVDSVVVPTCYYLYPGEELIIDLNVCKKGFFKGFIPYKKFMMKATVAEANPRLNHNEFVVWDFNHPLVPDAESELYKDFNFYYHISPYSSDKWEDLKGHGYVPVEGMDKPLRGIKK